MNKTIKISMDFFNLDKAFDFAVIEAKDRIDDKDPQTNVYKFRVKHISTTFQYYDFGDRNSYEYEFLIEEQ
jgi:hypothetical protein